MSLDVMASDLFRDTPVRYLGEHLTYWPVFLPELANFLK